MCYLRAKSYLNQTSCFKRASWLASGNPETGQNCTLSTYIPEIAIDRHFAFAFETNKGM